MGEPRATHPKSHKAVKEIVLWKSPVKGSWPKKPWDLPQDHNPMTGWREPDGSITVLCYRIRRVASD